MLIRKLVDTYIEGWREGNKEKILSPLSDNCVIIESNGPSYIGRTQIAAWVDEWNANGNIIHNWKITTFYASEQAAMFEWEFDCTTTQEKQTFSGATLAIIAEGKIVSLHEYRIIQPNSTT